MSKTHELRKKALEAVRDRAWDRAVQLYERICASDAGNGSPRNELGDIYLKIGDVENAIAQFQEAARLYQEYGLTNNAVAVHKKILRHDPNHLHSLWVLGEIRLGQGLEAEASTSFMDFLARADNVPEQDRDAFVSRGLQLIEKLGDDPEILSRLDAVFAGYNRGQERAQVLCAKARLAHEADEFEVRDKYIEHARTAFAHLDALPDFVKLRAVIEGVVEDEGTDEVEPGTTVLDESTDFGFEDDDLALEAPSGATHSLDPDTLDIDLGFDFDETELSGAVERASGPMSFDDREPYVEPEPLTQEISIVPPEIEAPRRSQEPRAEAISTQFDPAESDLSEDPAAPPISPQPQFEPALATEASAAILAETTEARETTETTETSGTFADSSGPTVDLLSEILADDRYDRRDDDQQQLATIEQEMRGQIGSQIGDGDHGGQYDLGIVYMDMGLFEQAADAFARAAENEDDRLRAVEMQGTCLLRLERSVDAMNVFQSGLAVPGYPGRSYLGLLYGVGVCHEVQGSPGEAIDYLERVAAVDDRFLDVSERLQRLRSDNRV